MINKRIYEEYDELIYVYVHIMWLVKILGSSDRWLGKCLTNILCNDFERKELWNVEYVNFSNVMKPYDA